jgi:hypothetical protein
VWRLGVCLIGLYLISVHLMAILYSYIRIVQLYRAFTVFTLASDDDVDSLHQT